MKTQSIVAILTIFGLAITSARTWTSSDGKRTFEGDLKAYDADSGQVSVLSNGKMLVFPEAKLSQGDREFLKQWRKEQADEPASRWPIAVFDDADEATLRKNWLFFSDGETGGGKASYTVGCSNGNLKVSGVLNKGRIDPPFFLMQSLGPAQKMLVSALRDSDAGVDTHCVVLRLKGNERKYQLYLTNEDNKTYGKEFTIPAGQKDWMEVRLPFKDFVIYGKGAESAPDSKLPDPQKIIGLEVKLRDGAYGPFELEVDEIAIEPVG